ncbi:MULTISPECIES: dermonecrotic toxin domain-containing protein [Dyella]|uniref:Dermonecrotic toxin N-terminal domain-containing protein n=2 Tax=Dyella TaxID=231454 RepID=A0A4R0YU15_9GAMM|nr:MULTISPECIES: DUF6543 domain-containing protein [Dyella]TBR35845.1 hypothetical protein EYV96_17790 [Dyella terrae]TCI08607.1 hypothetical protein EZM97_28765 [Dyella soli]
MTLLTRVASSPPIVGNGPHLSPGNGCRRIARAQNTVYPGYLPNPAYPGDLPQVTFELPMLERLAVGALGELASHLEPRQNGALAAPITAPLPPYSRDRTETNRDYERKWAHLSPLMPNIRESAKRTMAEIIQRRYGLKVDPSQLYFNVFKSAQTSDRSYTGWQHLRERPTRSVNLATLLITNFSAKEYLDPDAMNTLAGIYTSNTADRYDETNEARILPSRLINDVWNEDFLQRFNGIMAEFWREHGTDYYQFLVLRTIHDLGVQRQPLPDGSSLLSDLAENMVLAALGYPEAKYTLGDTKVSVSTFDIYGYTSSNMYVLHARDRWVLVAPSTEERLMEFSSLDELKRWIIAKAKRGDEGSIAQGFSLYRRQDGHFYSGVDSMLQYFKAHEPEASLGYIHANPQAIPLDSWSSHRIAQTQARMRDDTQTLITSKGEISEQLALSYFSAIDTVLPLLQPLTTIAEAGVHIDQAINSDTSEQRLQASWHLVGDVTNLLIMAVQPVLEGSLAIDVDDMQSVHFDARRNQWSVRSQGSDLDKVTLEDVVSGSTFAKLLSTSYESRAAAGRAVWEAHGMIAAEGLNPGQNHFVWSEEFDAYAVSMDDGEWLALIAGSGQQWTVRPSPMTPRHGLRVFDDTLPQTVLFRRRGQLQTVNDIANVVVTTVDGNVYLSDAPGGAPIGAPLQRDGNRYIAVRLAPELPVDWGHRPGSAEAAWMANARPQMLDVTHMVPDASRRTFTGPYGQRYLPYGDGFLPIETGPDGGLRIADGGPPISFTPEGSWKRRVPDTDFKAQLPSLDDVRYLALAFDASGQRMTTANGLDMTPSNGLDMTPANGLETQVKGMATTRPSDAFSFLVTMVNTGFRGTVADLAAWLNAPRTLPVRLNRVKGSIRAVSHMLDPNDSMANFKQANEQSMLQVATQFPGEDVLSALVEHPDDKKHSIVVVVPPHVGRDPRLKPFNHVVTIDPRASSMQVLTEAAEQHNFIVRHVVMPRPLTQTEHALLYSHAPDAAVMAPGPRIHESYPITAPETRRLFVRSDDDCGVRVRRSPGCGAWQTVINADLKDPLAVRAQALNHQVLMTQEGEQGLIAHDHRLYRADVDMEKLALLSPQEYGAIAFPLRAENRVIGRMNLDGTFGIHPTTPLDPALVALQAHTFVVDLGSIVQGVRDRRLLRAIFVASENVIAITVEPMPGVFYRATIDTLKMMEQGGVEQIKDLALSFDKLDNLKPVDQAYIEHHIGAWKLLQDGAKLPMPRILTHLPKMQQIRELMTAHGYAKYQIDKLFLQHQAYFTDEAARTQLLYRLENEGHDAGKVSLLPQPATSIARPTKADIDTAGGANAYYATEAATILKEHFQATGLRMANQRAADDTLRLRATAPMVEFVQNAFLDQTHYPHYYDAILRTGAGNCDEMALLTAHLINEAGGYAETYAMVPIHRFTVVGKPGRRWPTKDFTEPGWNGIRIVDGWIGWEGPASEYPAAFANRMRFWEGEGMQIFVNREDLGLSGWISPTDPKWLELSTRMYFPVLPFRDPARYPEHPPAPHQHSHAVPALKAPIPHLIEDPDAMHGLHVRDPDDAAFDILARR